MTHAEQNEMAYRIARELIDARCAFSEGENILTDALSDFAVLYELRKSEDAVEPSDTSA